MEHPSGTDLAARLRKVWDLSGRSLRGLAQEAGLSSSSLSRYIAGQSVPPWEAVVALCRVIGRDPRPLRPTWELARRASPAVAAAARRAPAPRNDLPSDVADFTGREDELAEVERLVGEVGAVVVDGMAGVGKSTLAVHAAHRLSPRFPDGRLYIDLHGFTPGEEPVEPADALRTLLIALDVPTSAIPDSVERLAARWRSELARRRVVSVLDNAHDAEQVRPLLPGAGSSAVIVTSRRRLVALGHVPPVSLDVLGPAAAGDLFRRAGGDDERYDREPEAVAEVMRLCGNLPLAIRLAAARLRHRPGWTIAVLGERLRGRTDDFDTACGMSLRQLGQRHRETFRRLALLPGPDFDAATAAAAAGYGVGETAAVLEDLVDIHLVQEPAADRFRLHDLVRGFAARTVEAEEPEAARRRAELRVLDHHLCLATAAFRRLPFLYVEAPGDDEQPFADRDAALAWYDREFANLRAAFKRAVAIGADAFTARLPTLLRPYFPRRGGWAEEVGMLEAALPAALRLGDRELLARIRVGLGNARAATGRTTEALDEYETAERLLATVDRPDVAAVLALRRGNLYDNIGDSARALADLERSAKLFEAIGKPDGLAFARAYAAWTHYQDGDLTRAANLAEEAMGVCGDGIAHRAALVTYAAAIAPADPATAIEHLRRVCVLSEADDHDYDLSWALNYLAVALRHAGRLDEAVATHREAMALLGELGEHQAAVHFLNDFGDTCRAAGRDAEALELHRHALDLARTMRFGRQEERARRGVEAATGASDPGRVAPAGPRCADPEA
ncbi:tetratricopeptide repeat protein [Phytomonospora sp. NPDC050363]|uniref:ATP-binding protein n=1 Tax=Phytomonospora sp. NPDC050363 TaxID=3155642 RepID=UPI0033F68FC0